MCDRDFSLWSEMHKLKREKILLQNGFDDKYSSRPVPFLFPFICFFIPCSSFWSDSCNHVPVSPEVSFLPSGPFSFSILIFFPYSLLKLLPSYLCSFLQHTQESKYRCHLYSIFKIPWKGGAHGLSAKPPRRKNTLVF